MNAFGGRLVRRSSSTGTWQSPRKPRVARPWPQGPMLRYIRPYHQIYVCYRPDHLSPTGHIAFMHPNIS